MGMPWRAFRLLPGYCLAFAYAIGLMVREAGWMPAIMADAYPMVERVWIGYNVLDSPMRDE